MNYDKIESRTNARPHEPRGVDSAGATEGSLPLPSPGKESRGKRQMQKPAFPVHSYPWYVHDWRQSMMRLRLSPLGRYVFRELLDQCYIDGSLEDDEVLLAKLTDVSLKEFRAVWPLIQTAFEKREDGKWHHHKADAVLCKLERYKEQKSEAGKRSGKARSTKAEHSFNGRSTYDEPSSSSSSTITTSVTTSEEERMADLHFSAIYKRHPKKQNKILAEQYFFEAINDGVSPAAIDDRHAEWCASEPWKQGDGRFAPALDAWLARKGWCDDAPPPPFDPGY